MVNTTVGLVAPSRPFNRRTAVLLALAAIPLWLLAGLIDAVREHDDLTVIDRPIAEWMATHRPAWLVSVAELGGTLTTPAVVATVTAVAILILWRRGASPRTLASVALAVSGTAVVAMVMKFVVGRQRPAIPLAITTDSEPAFPSGHVAVVAGAVLVALILGWGPLQTRVRRVIACVAAFVTVALVSVDRIILDAHWMTDVVGSVLLAAAVVTTVIALVSWIESRMVRRSHQRNGDRIRARYRAR